MKGDNVLHLHQQYFSVPMMASILVSATASVMVSATASVMV